MLFCNHIVSIDDFKMLASSNSDFHVKVKEIILISLDEPILNLFDWFLPYEIIFKWYLSLLQLLY